MSSQGAASIYDYTMHKRQENEKKSLIWTHSRERITPASELWRVYDEWTPL